MVMQIDNMGMDGEEAEIAGSADGGTGKDAVEFDHVGLEHVLSTKRMSGSVSAMAVRGDIA